MKQNIYQWGDPQNPTVIFVHGLGSTGLAFGELAKHLPEYHIVTFDLPGHGYAKALEEENAYFPSNLIVEIEKIINQQLGNASHYLIGHSLGADLALHYAAKYPKQLKAIILLDGGYLSPQDLEVTLENELQDIEKFCNEVNFPSWDVFFESEKEELSRWSEELEEASRAQVKEQDGEIRLTISTFTGQSMIKGIHVEPVTDIVEQVHCPALLIRATKPVELESTRKKSIQILQSRIKNLDIEPIADAGHDIFREAPKDVANKIRTWVENH
ncbi:alpha/beta hydrolase [Lysinibacillus xylanilyticus]|uniref:alpha/beta fold hydrolase n=1 Tax=Lysinibacillus xylanilyticus TaxID=582475 RepID=UPI002B25192F|nr:alpha/beta hydrolase [Lysinibacillus xylanilyticus]MEB2300150.1 alpha/beta hydrolase [Lysinibacillus xylanilyticus]